MNGWHPPKKKPDPGVRLRDESVKKETGSRKQIPTRRTRLLYAEPGRSARRHALRRLTAGRHRWTRNSVDPFSSQGNQHSWVNRTGSRKTKEPDDSALAADPGLHVALRANSSSPSSFAGQGLTSRFNSRQTELCHRQCPERHNRLKMHSPVDPASYCPPLTAWRTSYRLPFFG